MLTDDHLKNKSVERVEQKLATYVLYIYHDKDGGVENMGQRHVGTLYLHIF